MSPKSLCCPSVIRLKNSSLHPPDIASPDPTAAASEEIPWVLLEEKAYVADRVNDTTASTDSRCGKQIQATIVIARPPRVSYICVFCRCSEKRELREMVPLDPDVVATDGDLVLLRVVVRPEEGVLDGDDLYVYRPAVPSLTRLRRPLSDGSFSPHEIGLLSCPAEHDDGTREQPPYMVAALDVDFFAEPGPGRGNFVLYTYSSELETWSTTTVTVEDQQFQQYQRDGFFFHISTKAISVGGEGGTVGFVDLWRGILLCDLFRVRDNPKLRYVPLPPTLQDDGVLRWEDARIYRDVAVDDNGHFKYIEQELLITGSSSGRHQYIKDGWTSAVWSSPCMPLVRCRRDLGR
ncbi:hypothetical protein QOZ80_3AG0214690 [Eleusine coracana subsp. coracana]|nr:hypothetical protein QOZ80_3AG0214690 [Eleusine coracana subsp. coracana]